MKKSAGFLVIMLLSFIQSGSTFTLVPPQTVTAPISITSAILLTSNMAIQVNVVHFNAAWQLTPCPGAQVNLSITYPGHNPIIRHGVANSLGIATIPIVVPTSPLFTSMQYTATATWQSMTGTTIGSPISLPTTGNPAPLPVLVQ